jgi:hypothetical protein
MEAKGVGEALTPSQEQLFPALEEASLRQIRIDQREGSGR